ncbi:Uu.00g078110.m01.CDS01 [Anthostomella pinea]|uniref:Carboxylic ester hydrolase n=1 Tax=Anthostomella pinea TaxID=933095 RepID=A0AAI8VLP2_9PEZI|nr:Uu.00g078110.m01.CDS01 [Anthostomella pinea]
MWYSSPSLAGLSLLLLPGTACAGSTSNGSSSSFHVRTTSGEAHGTINATSPHVRQFLGIRYAEAPVSSLRFQPPERYATSQNASFNASALAPSCMQYRLTAEEDAMNVYIQYIPEFEAGSADESEDCLFLNVYAPLEPKGEKLPVLIWVPGGGFLSNGANVPYTIPDQWIGRTQELVVVTMNYRLGIFGFPTAAGQPLNLGLLDQRVAVEWARDNVAAFGGDPDRMILWGQSAGAWSVNYYGYAYSEDPIVAGLIADSGGSDVFSDGDPSNFTSIASAAGCGDLDAEAELACMQQVDASTIEALASNTTGVVFAPAADGVTVYANNTERAEKGLVAPVPAIIGTNAQEGTGFGGWTVEGGVDEEFFIEAQKYVVCPTVSEIQNRIANGLATYRYMYSGNFSNISPLPWIGAVHSGELPLLFGTHSQYRGNSTEFEWDVSSVMQGLWLAFAEDPSTDPTCESFSWPQYTLATGSMASFAPNGTVVAIGDGATVDGICQ